MYTKTVKGEDAEKFVIFDGKKSDENLVYFMIMDTDKIGFVFSNKKNPVIICNEENKAKALENFLLENNITSFAKITKSEKVNNLPSVSGKSFIGDKMNITEDMLIAARNGIEKLFELNFELNNDELRLVLSEAYQLWYKNKWLGFRGYSGFHSLRCPLCGGRLFAGISELENNKGKQFDPDIVDHTLKLIKQGVIKIG